MFAELEQVAAVAQTEHLTRAAERLGVPQPTLSRTMAKLGRELGTPVLVPEGRGVRLTRAGRLFAEHVERALTELHRGLDAARAEVSPEHGRVVLGFLTSMGPAAVPRLVRAFRRRYPNVRIDLIQDSTDRVVAGVRDGSVDVALVSPAPSDARLGSRELARQDLVVLVPIEHRWADRDRIKPDELAGEDLVTLRPGYGIRTLTDALLGRAARTGRYAFEAEDLTTAAGLVAAGLGVAILPAGCAEPMLTREVPLGSSDAARTIVAVWAADRPLTEPAAALRRLVITEGPEALGAAPH